MPSDPLALFDEWYSEATRKEPGLADACALATADARGRPSVRMVLLKDHDRRGFTFYTNLESRKGRELRENPYAALCFHWKSLGRQVRLEGPVEPVSDAEADTYWASRPRGSQLGAWASRQSAALESRPLLESAFAQVTDRFGALEIPRPSFWSGYRLVPERIEFWEDMPQRLHRRVEFRRDGDGWAVGMLYP